jgi:hypothetical protein
MLAAAMPTVGVPDSLFGLQPTAVPMQQAMPHAMLHNVGSSHANSWGF